MGFNSKVKALSQKFEQKVLGVIEFPDTGDLEYVIEISMRTDTIGWLHTMDYTDDGKPKEDAKWEFTKRRGTKVSTGVIEQYEYESIEHFMRSLVLATHRQEEKEFPLGKRIHCIGAPVGIYASNIRMATLDEGIDQPNADIFYRCTLDIFHCDPKTYHIRKTRKVVWLDADERKIYDDQGKELFILNANDVITALGVRAQRILDTNNNITEEEEEEVL